MTDTVTRLMALADEYAMRCSTAHVSIEPARIALEAELVRLFTPLSDEVVLWKWMDGRVPVLNFAREIEAMHGIGEAK